MITDYRELFSLPTEEEGNTVSEYLPLLHIVVEIERESVCVRRRSLSSLSSMEVYCPPDPPPQVSPPYTPGTLS